MTSRRTLLLSAIAALACPAPLAADDDPVAILNAVYARVVKGKGDGGGTFVVDMPTRTRYLSTSLAKLWAKADARTKKGDGGPVGFDPVTNSQDPDVKTFKVTPEKVQKNTATIAVTITAHHAQRKTKSDETIRYEFVRETSGWKIDDIKGTVDGTPWSVRALLLDSFKY